MATAVLLWSGLGLLTPPLLQSGIGPVEIGFWRAGIAGAAFVLHALVRRSLAVRARRDRVVLAVFGLAGVGLFYAALPAAIATGGVSLAWILLYTAPVWVALLAWPLLRERLTRRTAALIAVTVVGVVLVSTAGGAGVAIGPAALGWGLLSGLLYASWYLVGRGLSARVGPVTVAAWALPIGAVALAPFVSFAAKSPADWALIVGTGLAATYLPALAYYTGVRWLPAARAAVIATIEPVVALVLAAVFFGERLTPVALVGSALILAAALTATVARGSAPDRDAVRAGTRSRREPAIRR